MVPTRTLPLSKSGSKRSISATGPWSAAWNLLLVSHRFQWCRPLLLVLTLSEETETLRPRMPLTMEKVSTGEVLRSGKSAKTFSEMQGVSSWEQKLTIIRSSLRLITPAREFNSIVIPLPKNYWSITVKGAMKYSISREPSRSIRRSKSSISSQKSRASLLKWCVIDLR